MIARIFFTLTLMFTVMLAALAYFGWQALDTQPLVQTDSARQVANADTVEKLLKQLSASVKNRQHPQTISVSHEQMNSLFGFVQRAQPNISGQVNVNANVMLLAFTLRLPTLQSHYINGTITVLPANELHIDNISVGKLHFSGPLVLGIAERIVNWYTQSDIATQAREQIEQVALYEGGADFTFKPMAPFLQQLNQIETGLGGEKDEQLRELTAYYLRYASYRDYALVKQPQPLMFYLRDVMARAQQKSTATDAALHNKAALLALAVFTGHHRIGNFVGDIQPDAQRALKPAAPTTVRRRGDLSQHLIISAALKLLSEQQIGFAIGEFKELMDRAQGGSGYSFVDLAADMAGLRLAQVATDPATAQRTQQLLANMTSEDAFMPTIDDLKEGLRKAEFEAQYGEVDSPAYRAEVEKINQRLQQIPLYQ